MSGGYMIPCLCGNTVCSQTPEAVCEKCLRLLEVRGWGETAEVIVGDRK